MMLSSLNWSINHVRHIMSNESDSRHSQLNFLVLIMIIFCSFDDVFCKLSFIVGSNWYYPYSMRQLLGEVVINILCHYHHHHLYLC